MKIAVLHNRKPEFVPPDAPDDSYEEYDSDETIQAIVNALGARAEPVVAGRDLPALLDGQYDFVFNIAEGIGRRCREAVPAAVCELLSIPYTGSDPLTLAVTLDKAMARRIISPDVAVARAATDEAGLAMLRYPVIVKPNDEGSSKGIRAQSYCRDRQEALGQMQWLREKYECPVIVEEWLPGAEVTVGIRGNGAAARVIGMMEIAPAQPDDRPFVYSVEEKRAFRERIRYYIPPRLPTDTIDQIRHDALRAYELLGCRDIARIDFRLDEDGRPHFLECNPLPGLNPDSSDLVIATRGVIPYEQLVRGILQDAANRYGVLL